jgi:ribosome maturation factor RimP
MSIDRWQIISQMCKSEGIELFELEQSGNILRVYIHQPDGSGIQHAHCAGVSNKILNHVEVEKILPGSMLLEVSSPGVNRKLTRTEHFVGAIGERVKVSFRQEDGKKVSVIGILKAANDSLLTIDSRSDKKKSDKSEAEQQIMIPLSAVVESRVDFLFK